MNPFAQNKEITELKITQHDANLSPVVLVGDVSSEYYGYGGIAKDCGKLYP